MIRRPPRSTLFPTRRSSDLPVDHFLETHRVPIIVGTLGLVIAGLPLLYYMKFDFNPMNLRNPHAESIATYLDLRSEEHTSELQSQSNLVCRLLLEKKNK